MTQTIDLARIADDRARLESAMAKHYGPQWYVHFACDQRMRAYALAGDEAARERIIRYMKNDALELCERMAAVCVTAGMVTVPDGTPD